MATFTAQELRDLLSTIDGDRMGKWGDERSLRLKKLQQKLKREISAVKS